MFDIGFSELMVIGAVALVVIGPERLPKVARTAGHLLGRVQRYVNDVKSDISREMQLDELKKIQTQIEESARTLETSVRQEVDSARSAFEGVQQDTLNALEELEADARRNFESEAVEAATSPPLLDMDSTHASVVVADGAEFAEKPVPHISSPVSNPRSFDQTTPVT